MQFVRILANGMNQRAIHICSQTAVLLLGDCRADRVIMHAAALYNSALPKLTSVTGFGLASAAASVTVILHCLATATPGLARVDACLHSRLVKVCVPLELNRRCIADP